MKHTVRVIASVGVITAAALVVSGCSSDAGGGGGDQAETLRYMSYWTEGEPTSDIMKEAFAAFTEETGIKVDVTWQGRDLPDVLTPLLTSSNPTVDMVDFICAGVGASLVDSGKAADLGSVLGADIPGEDKTVEDVVSPDALAAGQFDGKTYCLPFELTSNFDIWYNAAEQPDLAANAPTTWDDFLALVGDAGKGSVALDGTIQPYADAWFINLAVSAAGKGGVLEAASDKTGKAWEAPEFLAAAEAAAQLVETGAFTEGFDSSKFPAIQQKWANNEAAFILNGSWLPAEVAPYAADGFEYASFPFPAIDADGIRPMQIDSIGFAAIEGSAGANAAKQFMAFFLQKGYQDKIGQIAVPARADADVVDSLAGVQKALADPDVVKIAANDGYSAGIPGWGPEVFDPLAQKLVLGEIPPKDFIAQLVAQQKAWYELQG
ncbi:ABC transporter substrate-binding protein [Microbacterium resistens]